MNKIFKALFLLLIIFSLGVGGFFCIDKFFPPNVKRWKDTSILLLDRKGELLYALLSSDDKRRFPITLKEVSPLYISFLKAYEDKRFDQHFGIDPFALMRAIGQLGYYQKVVSGASTLTMQVVRLLDPRPRTFISKIIESFRALQLEFHFSKKEILEMYLTLAPFGGNIEGIHAASFFYFDKHPMHLTAEEASFLVGIPKSPAKFRPDYYYDRALKMQRKVLERGYNNGVLSKEEYLKIKDISPMLCLQASPVVAPHVLHTLRKKYPDKKVFHTTLNGALQRLSEKCFRQGIMGNSAFITGAAMIMDKADGSVVAYIGSAFWKNKARSGYIDMVQAVRSPGSTLKPFIYALAFQEGLIHPKTLIKDSATNFSGYTPKNFYSRFYGDLTIEEAFIYSLNTPVVAILETLSPQFFVSRLQAIDVTLRLPTLQEPTLPIALGGVGTSLSELVALYSVFPRAGTMIHPRLLQKEPEHTFPFLGEEGTWYTSSLLQKAIQPQNLLEKDAVVLNPLPYKTGTSYGNRDAWAIGFTQNYVLGVWVGRCDELPVLSLSGYKDAAPLLSQLVAMLADASYVLPFPPERVISASYQLLPKAIQRFSSYSQKKEKDIKITFPLSQAKVMASKGGSITIMATHGKTPLRWFVNGQLFSTSIGEQDLCFKVKGHGWYDITVIDQDGHLDSICMEIVPPFH